MRILIFSVFISCTFQSFSQSDSVNLDIKYHDKVNTLDHIVTTLYAVISGEKGEARNWELFHYLNTDGTQMIPTGEAKSGAYRLRYIKPEDYVKNSGKWLIENGFFEQEIHREVHQFGNIAQVFSTYECYHSKTDKKPFMRGINSIQLLYDNQRWWVVNIFWAQESEQNPIPKAYGG